MNSEPNVNKFDPVNHEYTLNHTYTGQGCAHCGRTEEGHKKPSERQPKAAK